MATQLLDLGLLDEFPWLMGLPTHRRIFPNNSTYAPLLEIAQKRIAAVERHHLESADHLESAGPDTPLTITAILELDSHVIPGHAPLQSFVASPPNSISTNKVSQLTGWLLRYRLLDVLYSISFPERPTIQAGQPYTYPIPDPGKIWYKEMANWPNVMKASLNAMQNTSYFNERTPDTMNMPNVDQSNITAHLCNSLSSRLQETQGNFVISNFECAALYMNILYQLRDPNADIPSSTEGFQNFLRRHIPSANLEPLFQKLKKTQTFKLPLHMALAVSPLCLFLPTQLMFKDVNRLHLLLMWQGLGGARPQALTTVESKIFRALADVAIDVVNIAFTDASWLAPDPEFFNRISVGYYTPTHPSEIPFQIPTVLLPGPQGSTNDYFQPQNDPEGDHAMPSNNASGRGAMTTAPRTLPDPRIAAPVPKPVPQEVPQRPKRGKGFTVVHQAVDLTAEREVIPVHEIRTLTPGAQTYQASMKCAGGPPLPPACCFTPRFCTLEERDMFERLWSVGTNPVQDARPSQIVRFDRLEIETWSIPQVQSAVKEVDIVISGIPVAGSLGPHSRFGEANLKTLASLQRIIVAKDFSLPLGEQKVNILMKNLLDAVTASHPKIIRSDHFPIPDVPIHTPRGVSSDMMAWDATINRAWCRLHEFPRDVMRFATVATSSAYEDFHVPVNGFGVYLEVQVGSIWLLIGRDDQRGPVRAAECVRLNSGSGIVLRPGTPFFSLTIDDSIVKGSYWYASSNLMATATSIVRDFVASDSSTSTTDKSARLVLRRLAHFYYMVYTSGLFFNSRESDECAHTPDVTNADGLENLLSLCNLMELGNILAGDDYTQEGISEPERQELIEARRICRIVVDWIRRHFVLVDTLTQREQSPHDDVWMPFLARYVKFIRESKMDQAKGRHANANEAQSVVANINESISSNIPLQRHLSFLDIPAGHDPLRFPGFRALQITQRSDFLLAEAKQIVGENASDEKYHRLVRSLRHN